MTIREIDEAITNLIDPETGEILDVAAFDALQMERKQKAENMALWVLELADESQQIKAEIDRLKGRKESAERKIKSLKEYIPYVLRGEKLKTPLVSVSYRTSEAVDVADEKAFVDWAQQNNRDDLLRYKEPEIAKSELKEAIKNGLNAPGVQIKANTSIIIK